MYALSACVPTYVWVVFNVLVYLLQAIVSHMLDNVYGQCSTRMTMHGLHGTYIATHVQTLFPSSTSGHFPVNFSIIKYNST